MISIFFIFHKICQLQLTRGLKFINLVTLVLHIWLEVFSPEFGMIFINSISTIVSYLMPNPVYSYIYIYIYIYIGWNDKIVALEKTTWFHFRFNENRFSFFVADHLLVGQLCTNPKSDRSLLSCLKVIQCSTSEIEDVPLYKSCSLPIQVMTTVP